MFAFACPTCHRPLEHVSVDQLVCPVDRLVFPCVNGIWQMLLPERQAVYQQFIREYETVRQGEGRGSASPAYYQALPYRDLSGRRPADWRIRAASFEVFLKQVLSPVEKKAVARPLHSAASKAPLAVTPLRSAASKVPLAVTPLRSAASKAPLAVTPLRILDLGAGSGWLSNRLAARGHQVAAVDLTTNDFDGLGCYRYYETAFVPVQAEFDHLPFAQGSVDLVLFNASLHYATCYESTLREALRVLGAGGLVVILDTPFYRDPSSGKKMVAERQQQFIRQYGFPSNALASENYLTYERMEELTRLLNLDCRILTPFYGFGWLLRPWKARLLGQREPAKFHLAVLRANATEPSPAEGTC